MLPFACIPVCMNMLFGEWNSWETSPNENQLYMYVFLLNSECPADRQILMVDRFDPENPAYQAEHNGWWTVNQYTLWEWLNEGNMLMYNPLSNAEKICLSKKFTDSNPSHSLEEQPNEGELFMYILPVDDELEEMVLFKEIIVIRHFDKENFKNWKYTKWWNIDQENIISLFEENFPIIYSQY